MSNESGKDSESDGRRDEADSQEPAPKGNISLKIAAERRAERLRAELRANLARRKQQSRARREGAEDDRTGKLLADEEPAG